MRLRFRYAIEGDDAPWRPVQAFDDGAKVNIEFPRGIAQGEMPPLFVIGPEAGAELVNYRARQSYYNVDRLFAAAELRLGGDKQQKVRIMRTDGRPR
jgi:P-type conjugative transfer protein TrbG